MFNRCKHQWEEVGRRATPRLTKFNSEGVYPSDIERLAFGITVIELRCEHCGDIRSRELKGDHTHGETREKIGQLKSRTDDLRQARRAAEGFDD
jgi:hypothetical protein